MFDQLHIFHTIAIEHNTVRNHNWFDDQMPDEFNKISFAVS